MMSVMRSHWTLDACRKLSSSSLFSKLIVVVCCRTTVPGRKGSGEESYLREMWGWNGKQRY